MKNLIRNKIFSTRHVFKKYSTLYTESPYYFFVIFSFKKTKSFCAYDSSLYKIFNLASVHCLNLIWSLKFHQPTQGTYNSMHAYTRCNLISSTLLGMKWSFDHRDKKIVKSYLDTRTTARLLRIFINK